jgi:O-antigen/teichoic acid export membrane protein
MRQSHLMLSNASIMWVSQIFLLIPQFILVPFLIGTIGESGYGVYALVWSLMISIDSLEKSLQSGVVKYSAGFLAQGRIDEVNKVVSSSFVYSVILAFLACMATIAAAAAYGGPALNIRPALIVIGVMLLFVIPLTPYIAVIQSRQNFYVGAIAETVSKYVSLIMVVAWFHAVAPSVISLIVIMAVMLFVSRLAQLPVAYWLVPGLRNRPRLFDVKSFRLVCSFGMLTVLASFCIMINSTGVRWLMGTMVSIAFVAHLAIMLMPGLLLSKIIHAIAITAMPAASTYDANGDQRMLQTLLVRGMRYTSIMVLGGLLMATVLMRSAINAWVGPGYEFLAPYALILFAGLGFMQSTSIAHHILKGIGRLKDVVLIYFSGLVVLPVSLIVLLLSVLRDPYVATVAGLTAGYIVCGYLNVIFCSKAVDSDLMKGLKQIYLQPLIVAVPVGLITAGAIKFAGFDGLLARGCAAVSGVAMFFAGCYVFIATTAERQQFKNIIRAVKVKIFVFTGKPKRDKDVK